MSQQVTITITAKDGASQTFVAVGRSAETMASTAQRAGQTAADGISKIDKQAAITEGNLGKLGKGFDLVKGAAAGLVGSAVVGFLSDSARAAADAEAVMGRLETAVGNTGKAFADMEPAINAALDGAEQLAFDGEDAAGALTILTNTTGDASKALDLLGLTMDIARGRGVDLATAAQAVGKAADGNVGALQRMGVAVAEGATAQEALAQAQATFAGQSETYAATTQGAFDRIAVAAGNFQEQIGGMLGPTQTLLGILPGLSSGFSMVSGAMGALSGAGGLAGLLAMMNPLGLAAAALVGTFGLLAFAVATSGDAAAEADTKWKKLDDTLTGLGVDEAAQEIIDAKLNVVDFADIVNQQVIDLVNTGQMSGEFGEQYRLVGDEIMITSGNISEAIASTGEDALKTARVFTDGVLPAYSSLKVTGDELNQMALATTRIFNDQTPAGQAARDAASELFDQYNRGEITTRKLYSDITTLGRELDTQAAAADRAAASTNVMLTAAGEAATVNGLWGESARRTAQATAYLADENNLTGRSYQMFADLMTQAGMTSEKALATIGAAQQEVADSLRGVMLPALAEVPGAMQEIVFAGEDYLDVLDRMTSGAGSIGLADDLNDATQALNGTLGAMEQIAALNDPIEQAVQVVDDLMAPLGQAGELEAWMQRATDAINSGGTALGLYGDTLTDVSQVQDEYAAVLGGQVTLTDANERAGRAVNEMLLAQVPLVGEQASNLADYLEGLRTLNPEEQQRARYLMDSGNAAKIASAEATVYSAAVGEIPTEVASDIILNSAQADPVLAGILEEMGYISTNPATGEITVTIPDSSQLALDKFEAMFGEGNVSRTADGLIEVRQSDGTTLVYDQFNNLVDKTVTATVNIQVGGADSEAVLGALAGRGLSAEDLGYSSESTVTVGISADDAEFQRILADSRAAADEWAATQYAASLEATDNATTTIDATELQATIYADGTYDASLTATDDASTTIATPQDAADAYATGTYNATIAATDTGSTVIATVQGGADAYARVYTGQLDANDMASGIIADVQTRIGNLDGARATVYVDVVQNAPIPGRALGGAITRELPRAALGRAVVVGENGPEVAMLPYGTFVQNSTASQSRLAQESGGTSAEALIKRVRDAWAAITQEATQRVSAAYEAVIGVQSEMAAATEEQAALDRQAAEAAKDLGVATNLTAEETKQLAAAAEDLAKSTQDPNVDSQQDQATATGLTADEMERLAAEADAARAATNELTNTTALDAQATAASDAASELERLQQEAELAKAELDAMDDVRITIEPDTSAFDAWVSGVRGSTIGTVYMEIDARDTNGDTEVAAQLGRTIRASDLSRMARIWPAAANGRTVLVGEAGPELAFLPYGTQVMPSTASGSRMAADSMAGGMRFYGPVHIHAATPDIAREIQRQLATRSRA